MPLSWHEEEREDGQLAEAETEEAAREAAEIGGKVPPDSENPAEEPLLQAGEGEAEGFELAEKDLEDIASHGDRHRFPDQVPSPPEEEGTVEHGEADEAVPSDGSD
jgi:hypothetical protein